MRDSHPRPLHHLEACAARQRRIANAIGVTTPRMTAPEAGLAAADAVDGLPQACADRQVGMVRENDRCLGTEYGAKAAKGS